MPDTDARQRSIRGGVRARFRADEFDRLASERGATTDLERARLVGITRLTLYRWRTGSTSPNVGDALLVARALGVAVEYLFEVQA